MAKFHYQAKDSSGKKKSGSIAAPNKTAAKQQLKRMNYRNVQLKTARLDDDSGGYSERQYILGKILYKDKNGAIQINMGDKPPSTKDLILFTRQFATMIGSGVPMVQAIGILGSQQRIAAFGEILLRVRHAVENGATLSEAMEAFPKIFDDLYCSMVRAGEVSGNIDTILLKLTTYVEKADKIKGQVKGAMFYPAIVIFVAIAVIAALLTFVVPTFAAQYAGSGKDLPGITQMLIDMSEWLQVQWHFVLAGAFIGFIGFKAYIGTPPGRRVFDRTILEIPVIGVLLQKIAVGRFCSTLATMLTSGVNLLEALTICASSSGNKTIENFVLSIRARVEGGEKLSEPLGEGKLFPPMVVSMVSVGEETGKMDDMLTKVSEFYEDEVDLAVKTMLSMIEPILIVGVGGVIAVIVVAMYLPMFSMGEMAG